MINETSSASVVRGASQLDRFGDATVSAVCRALGADWGSFYYVDGKANPFGFRSFGVPLEFHLAYVSDGMADLDPLHPRKLVPQKRKFLSMLDARDDVPLRHYGRYLSFLKSFGAQDAAEMIFHSDGEAIAGMSLVWLESKPALPSAWQLGASLHSYVEFNLDSVWHSTGSRQRRISIALRDFALTDREMQVVDGVCRGCTNKEIAAQLYVGLATVKTHLIHIFEKTGVDSRGKLISRVLACSPD